MCSYQVLYRFQWVCNRVLYRFYEGFVEVLYTVLYGVVGWFYVLETHGHRSRPDLMKPAKGPITKPCTKPDVKTPRQKTYKNSLYIKSPSKTYAKPVKNPSTKPR